jgi:hypothetical protein
MAEPLGGTSIGRRRELDGLDHVRDAGLDLVVAEAVGAARDDAAVAVDREVRGEVAGELRLGRQRLLVAVADRVEPAPDVAAEDRLSRLPL